MAKVTTTEETRRQGRRLAALRMRLGLSKPLVADRLSFSATQTLDLYERGVSVIRLDQVERWAEAFGITADDFLEAVITDRQSGDWSFRAALRGRITEDLIDELAEEWEGRPILNQQAAVQAILQMAARLRDANTARPA